LRFSWIISTRAGRFRARWIHMRFSWMGVFDYLQSYSLPLAVRGKAAARLGHCIGRALRMHDPRKTAAPVLALHIQTVAIRTLELLCQESQLLESPPRDDPRWRRLLPVLQWMSDHPESAHDVPSLASRANLSPSRFYEAFKSAMGVSPMQHLWKVRVENAARLLLSTDETMAAIAEKCGFCDPFHFSRRFKSAFGLCPQEYRRRNPFDHALGRATGRGPASPRRSRRRATSRPGRGKRA
jgi:AraC-like DNA-binding protein